MLDFVTCLFLSIATITSLLVMAIGSNYRFQKLRKPKIILPKSEILETCQPFRAHRAFQMRRISDVDIIGIKPTTFQGPKEQDQESWNTNSLHVFRETSV